VNAGFGNRPLGQDRKGCCASSKRFRCVAYGLGLLEQVRITKLGNLPAPDDQCGQRDPSTHGPERLRSIKAFMRRKCSAVLPIALGRAWLCSGATRACWWATRQSDSSA
jgi:hypothetical protein